MEGEDMFAGAGGIVVYSGIEFDLGFHRKDKAVGSLKGAFDLYKR